MRHARYPQTTSNTIDQSHINNYIVIIFCACVATTSHSVVIRQQEFIHCDDDGNYAINGSSTSRH